eukprot:CAMPEP_0177604276 /NCGR_PEP_ID=MMETSP0419_2-20121207/16028_1 /TAXON_ID=582737 /ORGANISM="Tetraselmis sp., Strain GSL018" /LENGTH=345 /DNA_ID=CAMNT_0019098241 /DNA_START=181 /DNA_END=1218 /DNA_ORIENTATION=-
MVSIEEIDSDSEKSVNDRGLDSSADELFFDALSYSEVASVADSDDTSEGSPRSDFVIVEESDQETSCTHSVETKLEDSSSSLPSSGAINITENTTVVQPYKETSRFHAADAASGKQPVDDMNSPCSTVKRESDNSTSSPVQAEDNGKAQEDNSEIMLSEGEAVLSETRRQELLQVSEFLKAEGNELFGKMQFSDAAEKYAEAIAEGPPGDAALAVYHANRAACLLKLERPKDAADDCTAALKLRPAYAKALLRRSKAYELLDDLENAFQDMQKVVELEPENRQAAAAVRRMEPEVNARREKLKEEMMGKLKDLGNMVLGNFGLSLDNFQVNQDPETGGYSINFKQ